MEIVLNLSWLVVTSLLFASVLVAHRRGELHLSLKLALGCAAVLALMLFPVISMTDDLQQAQALSEGMPGHAALLVGVGPEAAVAMYANAMLALLALLLVWATSLLVLLARLFEARRSGGSCGRQEPYAVRPPPALLWAAA